jgi:hypothetical protein
MNQYNVGDVICSCEVEDFPKGTRFEFEGEGSSTHLYLKIVEMPDLKALELSRIVGEISNIVQNRQHEGEVITPVAEFVLENFTRNDA